MAENTQIRSIIFPKPKSTASKFVLKKKPFGRLQSEAILQLYRTVVFSLLKEAVFWLIPGAALLKKISGVAEGTSSVGKE